jgi:hypothetical protein
MALQFEAAAPVERAAARALPESAEQAAWESRAEPAAAQEDAEEQARRAEWASRAEQSLVPFVLTTEAAMEEPDEPEVQEPLRPAWSPELLSRLLESRPSPEVSKEARGAGVPAPEHAQPPDPPIAKQYESRARHCRPLRRSRAGVPRGRRRRRASWSASFCRRCLAPPTSRESRWVLLRARGPAH